MEYKLSKENYTVAKTLYDGTVQQSAELDYILPDYCPEIFKVLCVKILPGITKRTLSQGKLEYELTALVRLTYLTELELRQKLGDTFLGKVSTNQHLPLHRKRQLPCCQQAQGGYPRNHLNSHLRNS